MDDESTAQSGTEPGFSHPAAPSGSLEAGTSRNPPGFRPTCAIFPPRSLPAALGLLAVAATLAFAGRPRHSRGPARPEPRSAQPRPGPRPGTRPGARPGAHRGSHRHRQHRSAGSPGESGPPAGAGGRRTTSPPGPVDEVTDTPISTEGRLRQALERLGYDPTIVFRPVTGGVQVDISLKVADRVRQIFVDGNWPLRQEDIIRRLTIRPGPGAAAARAGAGPAAGARAPGRAHLPARRGLPGCAGPGGIAAPGPLARRR